MPYTAEMMTDYTRKWRGRNMILYRDYRMEYEIKHRAKIKAYKQQYYQENREHVLQRIRDRKANQQGSKKRPMSTKIFY